MNTSLLKVAAICAAIIPASFSCKHNASELEEAPTLESRLSRADHRSLVSTFTSLGYKLEIHFQTPDVVVEKIFASFAENMATLRPRLQELRRQADLSMKGEAIHINLIAARFSVGLGKKRQIMFDSSEPFFKSRRFIASELSYAQILLRLIDLNLYMLQNGMYDREIKTEYAYYASDLIFASESDYTRFKTHFLTIYKFVKANSDVFQELNPGNENLYYTGLRWLYVDALGEDLADIADAASKNDFRKFASYFDEKK